MNLCKCGCGTFVNLNYKKGHGRKGRKNSEYHNKRISECGKGRKLTQEQKDHIRKVNLGRKLTQEQKDHLRKVAKERGFGKWMIGRKPSQESIEKSRQKKIGMKCKQSTKIKISQAN